jgi:hypothetical protein
MFRLNFILKLLIFLLLQNSDIFSQNEIKSTELFISLLEADRITDTVEQSSFISSYNSVLYMCSTETSDLNDLYKIHKKLFKVLHDFSFKKYKEEANITGLFRNKEYNCLTAVILYYMICKDMGLKINMYETAYHIYITVPLPGKKEIIIEFTEPEDGFDWNQDKSEIIDNLLQYEYITKEELYELGEDEILKQFSSEKIVNPDCLPARYYSNLAFYALAKNDTGEAWSLIKKSVEVSPDSESVVSHNYIWQLHISNIRTDFNSVLSFLLASIDSIPDSPDFRNSVMEVSAETIQHFLALVNFNAADTLINKLSAVYNDEMFPDYPLRNLTLNIQQNKIRSKIIRGDYEDAYKLAADLFRFYPDDEKSVDIYTFSGNTYINNLLRSAHEKKAMEIADTLLYYLADINSVKEMYALSHIRYVWSSGLYKSDPEEGKNILLNAHKKIPGDPQLGKAIGYIYHELAMGEIRKRKYKKAIDYLNEGLKFDKDNSELQYELKLTKELIGKN